MKLPTGTIFLTKKDGGERVVTTVIPAQDVEMNIDHLLKCGDCGLRYNGADERCAWCGSKDRVKEIHSNTCRSAMKRLNLEENPGYPIMSMNNAKKKS